MLVSNSLTEMLLEYLNEMKENNIEEIFVMIFKNFSKLTIDTNDLKLLDNTRQKYTQPYPTPRLPYLNC
jgi:hypothetical protein